jgi:hypothetical protein
MKKVLTVNTPHGSFNRATNTPYTHIVVYSSPRADRAFQNAKGGECGVDARWIKDRGFGVTWHSSLKSAMAAERSGYKWDANSKSLGIFPVA